ncbi:MAG TPA: DUF4287 domain-containing protein [Rhizomicrobium sp.]|nr:DUF4287 domain-containing protein [Rhizomicrobium sp.]
MDQRIYQPSMSDLAVIAKTGKSWQQWFRILDRAGATRLDHTAIVKLLRTRHDIGPWWRRMVTLEYERARGLRTGHQTAIGYSVSVSRTMRTDVAALYGATSQLRRRRRWFPKGTFKLSSHVENKSFRGAWNGEARLEINYYERPEGRAQIVVEVNRLPRQEDVERERSDWRRALLRLDASFGRAIGPRAAGGVEPRTSRKAVGMR